MSNLSRRKPDFVDRVQKHWEKPDRNPLSESDKLRLDIATELHRLIADARTTKQIMPMLRQKFPAVPMNRDMIYRLERECEKLFGRGKPDVEYHRMLVYNWQLEALQIAKANQDSKAMSDAIRNMIKILGLDKENVIVPDYVKLMNQTFVLNVHVDGERVPVNLLRMHELDKETKAKLMSNMDDIDFEMVMDTDVKHVAEEEASKESEITDYE